MIRTLLLPAILLSLLASVGSVSAASVEPSCCAPQPVPCCETPCIKYRDHHRRCSKICCSCEPPIKTILVVEKPCTSCAFEVPVCLPACCTGAPQVCSRPGILGRKIVEYQWCCGFRVKMVFTHCGDLIVHSYY